jgi:hypothetical protein
MAKGSRGKSATHTPPMVHVFKRTALPRMLAAALK